MNVRLGIIIFVNNNRLREELMHNLVSKNQLSGWSVSVDNNGNSEIDKIDDYFDCLIECTDLPNSCRRICKVMLE